MRSSSPPVRDRLRGASQRLSDLLFPPYCLACEARLGAAPSPTLLCPPCRGRFVPIVSAQSCSGCLGPVPRSQPAPTRCAACCLDPPPFERLIAVWRYLPPLSEAIQALKFRRLDFLAGALTELAWSREPFADVDGIDLVAPIPLAPWRRWQRGFNQSRGIADRLGSRLALPVAEVLVATGLGSTAQSRLGRLARRAPARRRFAVRRSNSLSGRKILLVDDVVTTGATLRAGATALLAAGAAGVTAFALAATPARLP